jgi:hypothetical protein
MTRGGEAVEDQAWKWICHKLNIECSTSTLFAYIHTPLQPLCTKLSRPCQCGKTTSKQTRPLRPTSMLSLAQLDLMPGPVDVCGFFISNPLLRCQLNPFLCFSSHEIIRHRLTCVPVMAIHSLITMPQMTHVSLQSAILNTNCMPHLLVTERFVY